MKTTIIILNYNGDKWLKSLLRALGKEDCVVVVVDNNSLDGSANLADIQLNGNWGYAMGNNIGASMVTTENILFMNNDMLPKQGFIPAMEQRCTDEYPIVGAKLIFGEDKDVVVNEQKNWHLITKKGLVQHAGVGINEQGMPYELGRNLSPDDPSINIPIEVPAVTGACLMIKTKLFVSLRGFDTGFVNGYEDIDLCLRSGKKCWYEPTAEVIHYTSSSKGRFDHEDNNINLFKQRWGK